MIGKYKEYSLQEMLVQSGYLRGSGFSCTVRSCRLVMETHLREFQHCPSRWSKNLFLGIIYLGYPQKLHTMHM